jgi:hypothetical protein
MFNLLGRSEPFPQLCSRLPGEVQDVLDEFRQKNPKFDFPRNMGCVGGLVARVHDANKIKPRRLPGSAAACATRRQHAGVCLSSLNLILSNHYRCS